MKNWLLVISCWLLVFGANAQTLSLDAVLSGIEKNNPLLQSYQNKIKGNDALVEGAGAWMPPKAGLEFDQNPYGFDNFYAGTIRTSVMQDLPNFKMIDAKKNYLESISKIDLNESLYERNKLFSEAKEAYYGIYISEKKIKITKENIALLNSMVDLSQKQMQSGKGDLASIFKLKARLADKETMIIHDENMIKTFCATINYLMNTDVEKLFLIDTTNIVKNYKNLIYLYNKDTIENKRSDIMQVNSVINSMKLNQNVMLLNSKPIFGFKFENYAFESHSPVFSMMGTMTIPIVPWSAKGYKSEVKSMGFKISAMEQEKENMINRTSQRIRMLVIEMNSEYSEIENYTKKVLPAYKKSFDSNMITYGQNTGDALAILMAYDDLQMAQMKYIEHLETLLKVQVDYEKELQIR